MDFTEHTDSDLDALRIAVLTEQERRRTIATAPEQAETLATVYAAAIGRKDGDEWAEPTGAHDAYRLDAVVTLDGKTWESLTPANVWRPGVSGWRERVTSPAVAAWVQPTGAHDAYQIGAEVTHAGQTWTSTAANNTWEPGIFGWTVKPA